MAGVPSPLWRHNIPPYHLSTGSFLSLAIVNNAAKNVGSVYLFAGLPSLPLGKYPEMEWLDPVVDLVLIFEGVPLPPVLFSIESAQCLRASFAPPPRQHL